MNSEAKIHELEAKVAELTALVERMAPQVQRTQVEHVPAEATAAPVSTRRGMLKLAGAAAVGAAAAMATNAMPAAAATGDPMTVGESNLADTGDVTSLIGNFQALNTSSNAGTIIGGLGGTVMGWDTSNDGTTVRGGIVGLGGPFLIAGTTTTHGVVGRMFNSAGTGSGVYGISNSATAGVSAGLRATSVSGPSIQLEAVAAGAPTSGTWTRGAIQPDTAGNLWYCVATGTPGTWRKLTGAAAAGSFHALTPGRVYDSRLAAPAPGILASGTNRTVSVADRRDTGNGSVVEANFVPAGAIAVTANVTVTETTGTGFLAVNPGGNTTLGSSTINWFGASQNLANGVTLTLGGNRELTVLCGGGGSTHFIVDISGYYL